MTDEAKTSLEIALVFLKRTCINNGVSLAVNKENGELIFFDTERFLSTGKYDGIKVDIQSLVR